MKKIKKVISTFIAFSLISTFSLSVYSVEPETAADMSITAQELIDDITLGWNLGNTLDSFTDVAIDAPEYYETSGSNPITEKHMIDTVKETGINAVRVPVTWFYHMDENNVVDEAWMNRVQEVVDYVINNDMYCIINVHHDTLESGWMEASMSNYNLNSQKYQTLWTQIAENFKDYDEHLLFEGFNELVDANRNWTNPSSDSLSAINNYNQLFVDTVRATGGNNAKRCLVCNTYATSCDASALAGYELPDDIAENKLIAQVHSYDPYQFTFSEYPDVTTFDGNLSYTFDNIKTYLVDKGIPTIIGEFACYDKNNLDERIKWADTFTKSAAELGVKCFWWDDGNLLSRNFDYWKYPEILETCLNNVGISYACPDFPGYGLEKGNLTPYLYNYQTYFNGGLATVGYDTDSSSVTMHVRNSGSQASSVQLFYNNVKLEEGKQYKITFDAQCLGIDSLTSKLLVEQIYPSFADYFVEDGIEFTSTEKSFEYFFSIDELKENYNFNFIFCLGSSEADQPYDVTISNLMVTEYTGDEAIIGDVNPDGNVNTDDVALLQKYLVKKETLTDGQLENADINNDNSINVFDLILLKRMIIPKPVNGENLVSDVSEWGSYATNGGKAEFNYDTENNSVTANVSALGENVWDIQTYTSHFTLEKGKQYQITFDALSASSSEIRVGITHQIEDGNYANAWTEMTQLTPQFNTYTYTLGMNDVTADNWSLNFSYGNGLGKYVIKNVELAEIE